MSKVTLLARRPFRLPARRLGVAGAALGAAVLLATHLHAMMQAPADLDYARTRLSASGAYRATIAPEADPIPVGRLHAWTVHLETSAGQPVDGATLRVSGGMPQHGHGLPTKPRVTAALGGGDYKVEGMKFNMRGWWTVTLALAAPAGADSVTFNLKL
ncbi:MAG TPA: FixH family protein [Gemmatimonadales bacterium]|nr:FixH family protein [Gemmatimonadales bacterium]